MLFVIRSSHLTFSKYFNRIYDNRPLGPKHVCLKFKKSIKCVVTGGLYYLLCKCHNGVSKINFKWLMSYTPDVCVQKCIKSSLKGPLLLIYFN
jgi:hypothetical protein